MMHGISIIDPAGVPGPAADAISHLPHTDKSDRRVIGGQRRETAGSFQCSGGEPLDDVALA